MSDNNELIEKIITKLNPLLMELVGDNLGKDCTCNSCEWNREQIRSAIREIADSEETK